MRFEVFSIRDSKTGFMTPTFELNAQVAMRNFDHAVKNSDSVLFTHAKDFDLYHIGSYESDTGYLESKELPILVMSGASCLLE